MRTGNFLISSSIIALCSLAAWSQSVTQSWNEVQVTLPIVSTRDARGKTIDKVTATFSGTARIGRNGQLLDARAGASFAFRLNKHISALAGIVQRSDELTPNSRRTETRLDIGAILSTTLGHFTFKDRNMIERRFRAGRSDTTLYRHRLQVSYPIKRRGKTLFSPFVSEEGYYDITNSTWAQNEFYVGISRALSKRTAVDIAYVRNDSKPRNVNGPSITLKIDLR